MYPIIMLMMEYSSQAEVKSYSSSLKILQRHHGRSEKKDMRFFWGGGG
jgi:hypothetical protein